MSFRNATNGKTIKTLIFAAIILTLVIPMTGINMASATKPGKDIVLGKPSYTQVPVQKELRNELTAKLKVANETSKKEIDSELAKIDASVQQWFKDHTNPEKEKLAREKQKILVTALLAEEANYGGFKYRAQHLPWTGVGYDYAGNSLEVNILPQYFTPDSIPKYFEKIRSIVGDQVDISLSPLGYAEPTSCSYLTACNPLTGAIQYAPQGSSSWCSIMYAANYNGYTGFVSAGHCVVGAGAVVQPVGGSVVGNQQADTYYSGTNCDCSFMSATIPINHSILGYSPDPNNTAPPFAGMSVTMCGAGTQGCSSGSVTATGQTRTYTDGTTVNDLVESSYVSIEGDSGGPVVSGTALVGVQSAHDNNSEPSYSSPVADVASNFSGLTWCFGC